MARRHELTNGSLAPRIIDPSRRIILPQAVLDALGVKEGEHIGFIIEGRTVRLAKAAWKLEA